MLCAINTSHLRLEKGKNVRKRCWKVVKESDGTSHYQIFWPQNDAGTYSPISHSELGAGRRKLITSRWTKGDLIDHWNEKKRDNRGRTREYIALESQRQTPNGLLSFRRGIQSSAHAPTNKQDPSLFPLIWEHHVHSWLPFIFSSS